MEEEEKKEYVVHKVNAGYKYTVYKQERNGMKFYKIGVPKTLIDGQKEWEYIPVQFKKGIELENKTTIRIKQAFENFRYLPTDTNHWNPIFTVFINDFETINDKIEAYNEEIQEVNLDELPF